MFDAVFERSGESLLRVVHDALDISAEVKSKWVCTEHLLLVLAKDLEEGAEDVASLALRSMNISAEAARKEIFERLRDKKETEPLHLERPEEADALQARASLTLPNANDYVKPAFSQIVIQALRRAEEYSIFLGQYEVEPEHLLLAMIDMQDAGALKVFEELSVNLIFLRRQIMQILAEEFSLEYGEVTFREIIKEGMAEFVSKYQTCVDALNDLGVRSRNPLLRTYSRQQVVHMVCVTYLSDFLATQVGFQRYLLEESLKSLNQRVGALDKEITASIISTAAQNLRSDVRGVIEQLWCQEYRSLDHMLDDAEHDLIGSVIEDLWWAQSEEIGLHNLFDEALDDHRRQQLLTLQKRRTEVAQRLTRLRGRLSDTIRQCFIKHPISA
ncbi:MAG: Clp protease N-terminal domain-containing protein [Candidatus Obscuribacterales bacterium]|nr:Clp protease N-terminal domain-containing protein [Candidatus Obscuribacterales bacterium]